MTLFFDIFTHITGNSTVKIAKRLTETSKLVKMQWNILQNRINFFEKDDEVNHHFKT